MGLFLLFALMVPQAPAPSRRSTPPDSPPLDRVDRAMQLIHDEKYEMAYQALMDLVKDDPTNARAFPFLAAMEIQTGRLNDAEGHINSLIAHEPENADLRELSGQLYMAWRDWKKAEEQWRWIIGQRPNSEQAHMQLAAVLLQEDRYKDALAEVTRALEISPRRNDARSLRGNILAALGQINQAALDWNIALVGDPDDTVALSGLAVFLRETDPNTALKYAFRAVELTDWKALGPMRVLAMVYRARGENDLAKKTLERAMLMFPNNEALAAELRGEPRGAPDPASAPPAAPAKPEKAVTAASNKPAAPPAKSTATVAAAPPAAKPEPVIPKPMPPAPAPNAVVIPPLAVGGLTLGAAVGDLLAFDVLPLPPSAKVAEAPPPTAPKHAESTAVAKAVVPSKPPAKPAETSAPPAVTPPAVTPPPVAKPSAPAPPINVVIPPLAFGGLTLGAAFSDLVALEKLPSPPQEAVAAPSASDSQPAKLTLAPKPSGKQPPPIDLHWGKLPLSTISPAFVYGEVPPPSVRRP